MMQNMVKYLKISTLILLLSVFCSGRCNAQGRWGGGVEWGYSAGLVNIYHFNFIASEGWREDGSGQEFFLYSNGQLLAHADWHALDKLTIGLYTGYVGIRQYRRGVPLSLRATYHASGRCSDGWMALADAGAIAFEGFELKPIAKVGGGYRFALSRSIGLDLLLNVQFCKDKVNLYDPSTHEQVQPVNVRRNSAYYGAAVLSLGLAF